MDKKIKLWKTISIGNGLATPDDFKVAFRNARIISNESVDGFIAGKDFKVEENKKELKLALVKVFDLGFSDTVTADECIVKAKEIGLEVCSPEVGPQLRLQYLDQPAGEWILIGMQPVVGEKFKSVFSLEHTDEKSAITTKGLLIDLYNGGPRCEWGYDTSIVFILP